MYCKKGIHLFSFVIIFSITNPTFSQSEGSTKKFKYGINSSLLFNSDLYFNDGLLFSSCFTIDKGRHSIETGPLWWKDKLDDSSPFRGVIVTYKYDPFVINKNLQFYVLLDLLYTFERNRYTEQINFYPDIPKNEEYTAEIDLFWNKLATQIGYGISYKVYKGFYLFQSFSLGIEFFNYQNSTQIQENSSLSYTYSNNESGTSHILKIGLGYKLK